jgi:hypothetical protein
VHAGGTEEHGSVTKRLIPYAGAEKPKTPAKKKASSAPDGAKLFEQLLIEELSNLYRQMAKLEAEKAQLEIKLQELRSGRMKVKPKPRKTYNYRYRYSRWR